MLFKSASKTQQLSSDARLSKFRPCFDRFVAVDDALSTMSSFAEMCALLDIKLQQPSSAAYRDPPIVYQLIQSQVRDWKADNLWKLFDKHAKANNYTPKAMNECRRLSILIVGAGPVGLRLSTNTKTIASVMFKSSSLF